MPVSTSERFAAVVWVRRGVLGGVAAIAVVTLAGFVRFPQLSGSPAPYTGLALVAVALVGLLSGIALLALRTRPTTTEPADRAAVAPRAVLALGLLVGAVWVAYILLTHLALPDAAKPTVGAAITWVTLGISALAMLAVSAWRAHATGRFATALAIGLGGGVVAGLLALLTVVVMLDSAMGFLVQHMTAGELQAFAASGWANRKAWYYWNEEFVGSISLNPGESPLP
jgi:hypothetical protein